MPPRALHLAALLTAVLVTPMLRAELYINEIFFDPGGDGVEQRDEFIELRGAPGMPLDDHYLIFVENEDNGDNTGPAGLVENIFTLDGYSLGSNGFLVFRQAGNLLGGAGDSGPSRYSVVPGATDLVNTGAGPGYGSGATSTIGAEDEGGEGSLENGGFTAMLIRKNTGPVPTIGLDLDEGNDGLDNPNGQEGWEILDAIGYFEPLETVYGRSYAPINFGREEPGELVFFDGGIKEIQPNIEPDAVYVGVGYEIEYLGRWGNSTGQTNDDWHISNLTDNPGSGRLTAGQLPDGAPVDYRQSYTGDHGLLASGSTDTPPTQPGESQGSLESNKDVPYGTRLLTNIGGPNYLTGDYNGDGYVNAADYTIWRDSLGAVGDEFAHPAADANHNFMVDGADYEIWRAAYGAPEAPPAAAAVAGVPEPASALLVIAALPLAAIRRRV
ncbi:hypothetical protein KOR34_41760 [Posidoniimonas corsicana]|uniref:LTD domain-containing protein n=1 Tax=Posidoniimonas corsicana TaxID=1938618 RepID=A0A5C5V387_9BACT|nr:hypothetical protein [Posidoniimonas corsicana]TWT32413.1 hypothetical protein KOR34_41760 [Posidoniimonas corsicana]